MNALAPRRTDGTAILLTALRRSVDTMDARRAANIAALREQAVGTPRGYVLTHWYLDLPGAPACLVCPVTGVAIGRKLPVYTGGLDWSEFEHDYRPLPPDIGSMDTLPSSALAIVED